MSQFELTEFGGLSKKGEESSELIECEKFRGFVFIFGTELEIHSEALKW